MNERIRGRRSEIGQRGPIAIMHGCCVERSDEGLERRSEANHNESERGR